MKFKLIIFLLILLLTVFIRFYRLDSVPPSLNWDEISHGYNAYSILKTGYDEWGQFFPLANFRAYGDYPLPLYMYLTMPWILLFGLNELSIRLTSAIFGSLTVLVLYFLALRFTKKDYISSLFVTFMASIAPWTILPSRQVIQSTPAIFFICLGILCFLKGLEKKRIFLFLSSLSFGLSAYAYHNTRIIAPFIFLSLILFNFSYFLKIKKILIGIIILMAVFFLPLVPVVLSPEGSARATWVGILDQGAINRINQQRGDSSLPQPIPRLLFNKITYFSIQFVNNYIGYFTPAYLSLTGGSQYQFSIPGFGLVSPIILPFFYLGLLILIFRLKTLDVNEKFLLILLLLSPIPAAITRDPYQVIRSTTMIVPVFLVSGIGFKQFLDLFNRRAVYFKNIILTGLVLVSLVFSLAYLDNLFFIYPKQYSFAWQYGYRQVIDYVINHQAEYQTIAFTKMYGEPHEFFLFFTQYDPNSYRNDLNLIRYPRSDWFWVDGFSKYLFINDWDIKDKLKDRQDILLVTSPGNYPPNAKLLTTVYFLDETPAFDLVKL